MTPLARDEALLRECMETGHTRSCNVRTNDKGCNCTHSRYAALARIVGQARDYETLIAQQLTPLDVAVTHIQIIRRKGDDYTEQERDNVGAIVEQHVTEARRSLFAALAGAGVTDNEEES